MKNIKYIIITALVVIAGVLIFIKVNNENKNTEVALSVGKSIETINGSKELSEINYEEFIELVNNDEDFIIMVGSSTCPHCSEFKPRLELYNYKYDLDIKYIVINEVPTDFIESFLSKVKMSMGNETGTPKTIYFEGGVMQSYPRIYGAKDNTYIETFLKGAGVTDGN